MDAHSEDKVGATAGMDACDGAAAERTRDAASAPADAAPAHPAPTGEDAGNTAAADPASALLLENQLCFPLYACSKEIVRRYKPLLDPLGLTYTQYICMMVLWEEGSSTIAHLGKRLYLDSGTLTPVVRKLEDKGYVTRRRSKADERVVDVALTEQGRKLKQRALSVPHAMASCISLPREDALELKRLLEKTLSAMR